MTHRPSRLFPILLIVLLGGLTFWLDTITDWLGMGNTRPETGAPDYVLYDFTATVFDGKGQVKQTLVGKQAWQFPHNDTIYLQQPHLKQYAAQQLSVEIVGAEGQYNPKRQQGYFAKEVTLTRFRPDAPPSRLVTTQLSVDMDKRTARTAAPAVMTQGGTVIRSVGLAYDDTTQFLNLPSRVKITHAPPPH